MFNVPCFVILSVLFQKENHFCIWYIHVCADSLAVNFYISYLFQFSLSKIIKCSPGYISEQVMVDDLDRIMCHYPTIIILQFCLAPDNP